MYASAIDAAGLLLSWEILLAIFLGTVIGAVAAAIPGVSGVNAMALLLPLTFGMGRVQAIVFLVAIMSAGGFAGAVTSILLNVPGEGVNAATTLDGYPMARQGRAGEALGAASAASLFGALFGAFILILSLPLLRTVLLSFGPPEVFAFSIAGVAVIASVTSGSKRRGMIAGVLGLTLGTVGISFAVGDTRFTFGSALLFDGIPLIPFIIGLFAFPELFELLRKNQSVSLTGTASTNGIMTGVMAVVKRPMLVVRSSLAGVAIGIIPGVGGAMSSWVAYFAAVRASKDPESFGKGNIEGVIAPEAANDSKGGGSLMPLLALGIPGSISTAILAGAFMIHGVTPGQRLFQNDMPLVWGIIFALIIANIITSVLGLLAARPLVKLTLVPASTIAPLVVTLALIGSYVDRGSFFGIITALIAGLIGIVFVRFDLPRPPLLIGAILLPIAENNFIVSTQISRGSYSWLWTRPITVAVLVLAVLLIFYPSVRAWLRRRWTRARSDKPSPAGLVSSMLITPDSLEEASSEDPSASPRAVATRERSTSDQSALGPLRVEAAFFALLTVAGVVLIREALGYRPEARLFPLLLLVPLVTMAALEALGLITRRFEAFSLGVDLSGATRGPVEVLGWFLLAPFFLWAFGAVIGSGLYVAVFRTAFGRRAMRAPRELIRTAAMASIFSAVIFLGFRVALSARIPRSFFF